MKNEIIIKVQKDMSFGDRGQFSYVFRHMDNFYTDGVFQDDREATLMDMLRRVIDDVERKVNNAAQHNGD